MQPLEDVRSLTLIQKYKHLIKQKIRLYQTKQNKSLLQYQQKFLLSKVFDNY